MKKTEEAERAGRRRRQSTAEPPSAEGRRQPCRRRVLTVTELTVRVRDLLEAEFFEVWVEGELSNCRVWNTGHLYFTLKDGASQIKAVIFRSALRYLKFKPADGLRVVARGRVSVYEPKGEYQLGLRAPRAARARRAPARLRSAEKAAAGRRAVRRRAQAAAAGAAAQDRHRHVARRRGDPRHHQGAAPALRERAPASSARPACRARTRRRRSRAALRQIARVPGVDVVIVGRGGGSIEDLWAFNEEVVARAIARVPVPVISAVGHETDVTIADFVADVRAPTPSAARGAGRLGQGRISGPDRSPSRPAARAARARVQRLSRRVHMVGSQAGVRQLSRPRRDARTPRRGAVACARARIMRAGLAARERRRQQIERQLTTFDLGRRLAGIRTRLVGAEGRLTGAGSGASTAPMRSWGASPGRLDSLSPLAVLGRGYAVAWNADQHPGRCATRPRSRPATPCT